MPIETGTNDVIVADNDYIIRNILRSLLEDKGLTVLSAIDGQEAVDYAKRTIARFVILDLRMPKLDGFAACSQIRQLPGYPNVPIAILSAFPGTETREAAKSAGATIFLSKPFTPIELLRAIAKMSTTALTAPTESTTFVWPRRQEPSPLYGEPVELSEGRRVLNICRR
jgi:CheY-like chemotaxis protein